MIKELMPVVIEKIAEIQGKTTISSLKKENEDIRENLFLLEKKVYWIAFFLVLQSILLIVILLIFLHMLFLK